MKLLDILKEVMGDYYPCWWLGVDGNMVKVNDHLNGAYQILGDVEFDDISDVYEMMYLKKYIRVMKNPYKNEISFEHNPSVYKINHKQIKALIDFSIENECVLLDDVTQKYISLLESDKK